MTDGDRGAGKRGVVASALTGRRAAGTLVAFAVLGVLVLALIFWALRSASFALWFAVIGIVVVAVAAVVRSLLARRRPA